MYTHKNFKTKKAFKQAVTDGEQVTYFQVGPYGGNEPQDGTVFFEGPHYPEPHRWYAKAEVKDGVVIKVA